MGGGKTAGEGLIVEVLGIGARAELFAPEVDGVRSRGERGVKRLFTPCRCEQFRQVRLSSHLLAPSHLFSFSQPYDFSCDAD